MINNNYFSNFSIVIVDDYEHSQLILKRLCEKNGFKNIIVYENGKEFIDRCINLTEKPDFVLMDIQMPIMNGFDAFMEAKQLEYFKNTIFFACTAFAMKGDREWILLLGFDAYVPKPIDSSELISLLKSFIVDESTKKNPKKLTDQLLSVAKELVNLRYHHISLQKNYLYKLIPEKIYKKLEKSPGKLKLRTTKVGVGFVDIRGFTHLSNILPVDELKEVIEAYFSMCAKIIEDSNCYLDKFIGDGVLWFSSSNSEQNSAEKVLRSAVKIIKGIPSLNKEINEKLHKNIQINVGIGLSSGSATIGLLGAPAYRIQYSVLGPPVNLASRLCSSARINEIILGGKIIDYCKYKYEKLGFVAVKGFEYDIEMVKLILRK